MSTKEDDVASGRAESGSGGQPQPRRGIDTRSAISAAATGLFFKVGFHAATMKAIGEAANVQAAAIYYWYPSKEALLVHLQDDFMNQLTESVESAVAPHDRAAYRLAAAVRAHVVFHALHQQEAFVTDSEIRALTPEPRQKLISRRDAYQQFFYDMILDGVDEGDFSPTDPRVATFAILLQCTGVSLWFKTAGAMTASEVADSHVDLVLGSLHTDLALIPAIIEAVRGDDATEATQQVNRDSSNSSGASHGIS